VFNTCFSAFYYTNNTATNITGHIKWDAIFVGAPLTNVGLLGFAVEVTLLGGDENVPFVPFEGGEGFVPVRAARAPKYAGLRVRVSSIMQAEPVPGKVDGTHEYYPLRCDNTRTGPCTFKRAF
jgi:hypothetical protein